MSEAMDRRRFLGSAAATGMALGFGVQPRTVLGANEKIVVGVMGTGGRGTSLAETFAKQAGVEVAYCCDTDRKRAEAAASTVGRVAGAKAPQAVTDFRKVLDDKAVQVLVVATPNHWHAPAAILGASAGKHVYVEKPCGYNPDEGELLVAAARKHNRRIQMGNQRRSYPKVQEAIAFLRDGGLGEVYYVQSQYTNNRPATGKGKPAPVPEGLEYDLWQGPAPRKPFHDNYLHYTWHWFWHWGNGELGNNGIHSIDLCRWGLGVEYPTQVTSTGGRFRYDDDQETPDTNMVTYVFDGGKMIMWEGMSCNRMPAPAGRSQFNVTFHGEKGSLVMGDASYSVYDPAGKEVKKSDSAKVSDDLHIGNFLAAVRGEAKLNSEIEEGHKSTLLCHLGNIAYRTGRALKCDPKQKGRIVGDKEAMALWKREYEKGWEPKV